MRARIYANRRKWYIMVLECVSKIPEYAISGVAVPFLRHKARLSAAKPSGLFLELTQNLLELQISLFETHSKTIQTIKRFYRRKL